jgi:hypothetical protein
MGLRTILGLRSGLDSTKGTNDLHTLKEALSVLKASSSTSDLRHFSVSHYTLNLWCKKNHINWEEERQVQLPREPTCHQNQWGKQVIPRKARLSWSRKHMHNIRIRPSAVQTVRKCANLLKGETQAVVFVCAQVHSPEHTGAPGLVWTVSWGRQFYSLPQRKSLFLWALKLA